ncbi:GNAT family N-acetyltransferase [Pseudoroseicyclus sp. CXY001]|uniref:GNAT family N-acetyltransferase n=1 Tax=Pseudoroseicyclus sp. CXY001 TaxID=3242492 RepID=UPI00358DB776
MARLGGWTIREGRGGGSRVSAATWEGPGPAEESLAGAEDAMRALGQTPLVMVRAGQEALDRALEASGWRVKDPVVTYAGPASALPAPGLEVAEAWPPGPEARAVWAEGGIGPERIAVMDRAAGPKVALGMGGGVAYVALHDGLAMLHALEVLASARRRGLGRALMGAAGAWAARQGAGQLVLLVTRANAGANALYAGLGMAQTGGYHYRELAP